MRRRLQRAHYRYVDGAAGLDQAGVDHAADYEGVVAFGLGPDGSFDCAVDALRQVVLVRVVREREHLLQALDVDVRTDPSPAGQVLLHSRFDATERRDDQYLHRMASL